MQVFRQNGRIQEVDVALSVKKIKSRSNLHRSIGSVLVMAQCFALMPVHGVLTADVSRIRFKWMSFKMIYSLINLSVTISFAIMNLVRFMTTGMQFGDIVSVVYFTSITLTIILFIKIACQWANLSKKWRSVELAMSKYEYQPNLSKRFKITAAIVMLLALGEHILFILKITYLLSDCSLFKSDPLKTYFGAAFSQIFALTTYSHWKAFLMEFFNILATFAWNFMDLFIMIMSSAIAEKFRQINKRVDKTEIRNELFWKGIREDYNRLSLLCKSLDEVITHLVSLSFANNLFFIVVQLFNTLKPISGAIHTLYFVCSFGFMLGRTAAVSVYAAWINDESVGILSALFDVPSEYYGTEAARLIQQVSSCPIAITGSNYFMVTRDLCLKVAGAIVTFELILQQLGPAFLNTDDKSAEKPFCLN